MWDSTAWMKTTKTPRPMFQIDDNISRIPAVLRDRSCFHVSEPQESSGLHSSPVRYAMTDGTSRPSEGEIDGAVRWCLVGAMMRSASVLEGAFAHRARVLAELFDRDNLEQRVVIGYLRGSGFTQANVDHGLQSRSHVEFAVHDCHVSEEAQAWRGYFFGLNALKPCMEPVLLAQKPIGTQAHDRQHPAVWYRSAQCRRIT